MKKKELNALRPKKEEELEKLIREKVSELDKFMIGISSSSEKNLKKGKKLRRDIAQIMTLIRERKLQGLEAKEE